MNVNIVEAMKACSHMMNKYLASEDSSNIKMIDTTDTLVGYYRILDNLTDACKDYGYSPIMYFEDEQEDEPLRAIHVAIPLEFDNGVEIMYVDENGTVKNMKINVIEKSNVLPGTLDCTVSLYFIPGPGCEVRGKEVPPLYYTVIRKKKG